MSETAAHDPSDHTAERRRKRMKTKTKKRIGIAAAIILLLALTVDILGANYLVSFAIGRTTSGGASVVPAPSTTGETESIVGENTKKISAEAREWLEQVEAETVSITSPDGFFVYERRITNERKSHNPYQYYRYHHKCVSGSL